MSTNDAPESAVSTVKDDRCITWTPTIMSGVVVRFYENERALTNCHEFVSVSREGVSVDMTRIKDDARYNLLIVTLCEARRVFMEIVTDRDVKYLATHERQGSTGPMERIA